MTRKILHLETIAIHSGERNKKRQHRPVTTPIEQTAAYYFDDTQQIIDFHEGKLEGKDLPTLSEENWNYFNEHVERLVSEGYIKLE